MTYFEDLTDYSYYNGPESVSIDGGYLVYQPPYRRLNVGWLDAPRPVPTGDVPAWVSEKLLEMSSGPRVNVMRGFHTCTYCTDSHRGNSELRVPGEPGVMFAAPSLIGHYVTAHAYLPPRPFIDALATYDHPGWLTDPDTPWIPPDAER